MINERSNRVVDGGGGESVAKSHRCHCHLSLGGECLEFYETLFYLERGVGVGGLVAEVDL